MGTQGTEPQTTTEDNRRPSTRRCRQGGRRRQGTAQTEDQGSTRYHKRDSQEDAGLKRTVGERRPRGDMTTGRRRRPKLNVGRQADMKSSAGWRRWRDRVLGMSDTIECTASPRAGWVSWTLAGPCSSRFKSSGSRRVAVGDGFVRSRFKTCEVGRVCGGSSALAWW